MIEHDFFSEIDIFKINDEPFDGVAADLLAVDFGATRVSENGTEGRAADVLRHFDHVAERGVVRPVRAIAGNRAYDVFAIPVL